ncbi:Peptidase family M23 [Cyclonatronum proteinivorum]|uniref:Peptidase family M23 n=1 Tax=Cyclonatronum proteinivorum TaxID=1457365 RepID=A0A345UI63_9BACT|nr:M23 family metallopeptidase [Cyclonatronum proteinivorum]AXJ00165.1 Peptidase family M23 [Cyclonatronum proteinivorum]
MRKAFRRLSSGFFLLSALFVIPLQLPLQAQELRFPDFIDSTAVFMWPTNASDYFSATFAETRSAHFHAAADIGTWGREGFEVYATRDALLYRVGISPHGYGNVIYLQHDDGSFSVYAHLQDFEPGIRELVDSYRFQTYRHSFDKIVADYGIRFSQGDLIGISGSTGIGPPHLHFELRSPWNDAFNPKLVGIDIADSVPPTFSGLAVLPKSADALVNGGKTLRTLTPARRGGTFDFGRVTAEGTIGLAVNASDRSDNGRNVYAVYELQMRVNGTLFFHSRVDSFPMAEGRQMLIDRVYPLLLQRRGGFQRLHILPGNTLPFYDRSLGDGLLRLEPGLHNVEIVALDYSGNRSVATLTIHVPQSPRFEAPEQLLSLKASPLPVPEPFVNGASRFEPHRAFEWNSSWIRPRRNPATTFGIQEEGSFHAMRRTYTDVMPNQAAKLHGESVRIHTGPHSFRLHQIRRDTRTTLRFPAYRMVLHFPPGAAFDTTYVHATRFTENGREYIRISPDEVPMRRPFQAMITLPDSLRGNTQYGLYFVDERRNREVVVSGTRIEGNTMVASLNGFGRYVIRPDTTAPSVTRPRIWQRRSDRRWFVSVRAVDLDSGLNFNEVYFTVNGVRGIAEYDPFSHTLRYHHPEFTPKRGINTIFLRVPDHAGNITEQHFEINR